MVTSIKQTRTERYSVRVYHILQMDITASLTIILPKAKWLLVTIWWSEIVTDNQWDSHR